MTQEDKKLLLNDLCTRLPYGVKVAIEYTDGKYTRIYDLREIDNDTTANLRQQVTVWNYGFYSSVISYPLIDCRPYLRPMKDMTEEEREDYNIFIDEFSIDNRYPQFTAEYVDKKLVDEYIDWLNAHHFDYRGLIEKGLALEAPKGMYGKEEQK